MGDGVKGLVKGGQLDVGWLECGLCPVRCVGDLLPTWVGPRFKYLVAAYYFDWWGWLYVQDAACNVLSIGGLHCGGFSLDSGVGREGSLLLRTLSFDERVWGRGLCGLRGGFWGFWKGKRFFGAKPFRKNLSMWVNKKCRLAWLNLINAKGILTLAQSWEPYIVDL